MADGHGGYRQPSNPAAVSGPGALSQRTDGAPHKMTVTDMPYGEAGALNAAQSAAPLSAPGRPTPQVGPVAAPVQLGEPSANPNEPVTAGADAGPGVGSADIGLAQDSNAEIRAKLGPRLPVLMRMADAPYATAKFKREVRQLIARING